MERFIFDHPDLRRAAAIISGAKIEAKKIIPGADEKSLNRRNALCFNFCNNRTSNRAA